MSLLVFLTVSQAIIAALLVGVILMQKSEGGGLGTGGSPAGLMSARGAADFMTRLTAILATVFVALSIVLAALATQSSGNRTIDDTLDRSVPVNPLNNTGALAPAPAPTNAPAPAAPATN
ncbi:MAG: preprotein translocase subunit SecG [Novosphingobium sp.]|nr:preprotein translocase subunit SecG [Novosphingobium sp.]MBX9642927.1 preprotein translocase subunit SecG [Novosphingobium sp.]